MSRKIGALWLKKTKDGKSYMSGMLNDLSGDIQIAVFKNDRKEKDSHPDYQIILSEKRERQEKTGGDDFFGEGSSAEPGSDGEKDIKVDDIPF